jgi:hypothetical protein
MVWLIRLLTWDGLLPVAIWLVPLAVRSAFPRNRDVTEAVGIVLPILVLFARFGYGCVIITTNSCNSWFRFAQLLTLCAAILGMMLLEVLLMMSHEAHPMTLRDLRGIAMLIGVYLVMMAFATYPGRATSETGLNDVELDDVERLD